MPMFEFYPKHWTMSYQFLRLLSEAHYEGGDFHEMHKAGRKIPDGDMEAWWREWHGLGEEVEKVGDSELKRGHRLTARSAYLRAFNYYRTAEFFLLGDERKIPTYKICAEQFEKAAKLFDPPFEQIEVPYEGSSLPGWFIKAKEGKGPAFIMPGGADSVGEEMYFLGGQEVLARGIHLMLIDGPGQGAALRLRNIFSRHDYEVPISACVDFLSARPDVDPDNIGLLGCSFGGYYGTRAAGFEHRVKALVIWGACYNVLDDIYDYYPAIQRQIQYLTGSKDDADCREKLEAFNLEGVVEKIRCPVLITHGAEDKIVRPEAAKRTYEELTVKDKTLHFWTPETLGEHHCQQDNIPNAVRLKFDWLADHLK
ncbi:MAG: alpha/beta hydrolase family protein [Nitrospinota bacterium]